MGVGVGCGCGCVWVGVGIEGERVGDGCFRSQQGHVEWVGEKEDTI